MTTSCDRDDELGSPGRRPPTERGALAAGGVPPRRPPALGRARRAGCSPAAGDVRVDGAPRRASGSSPTSERARPVAVAPRCSCGSACAASSAATGAPGGVATATTSRSSSRRRVVRFADEIGIPARTRRVLARARAVAAGQRRSPARPPLPVEVWDDIVKARGRAAVGRRSTRASGGRPDDRWHARRGRLPRETVAALAEALDDDQLRWWASPDVEWDAIVEITPAGTTEVIDFTVPGHHNFVAADLYLHNTAFGLGHGGARGPDDGQAGARVLARDGPRRADPAHPVQRGAGRLDEDAQRTPQRGRLGPDRPGDRAPRGAAVPRRQPAGDGDGDPRQGPPDEGPPRRARR